MPSLRPASWQSRRSLRGPFRRRAEAGQAGVEPYTWSSNSGSTDFSSLSARDPAASSLEVAALLSFHLSGIAVFLRLSGKTPSRSTLPSNSENPNPNRTIGEMGLVASSVVLLSVCMSTATALRVCRSRYRRALQAQQTTGREG